jgi:hypothetical protein
MQQFTLVNSKKSNVEVGPYFATLVEEDDEFYTFQIVFRILQSEIVRQSLSKVVVSCSNPNVIVNEKSSLQKLSTALSDKKPVVSQVGKFEIDNILLKHAKQLKLAKAKQNSIIASAVVNLEPYVNSAAAPLLRNGVDPKDIDALYSVVDTLELLKSEMNLNVYTPKVSQSDIKHINLQLISQHQVHPLQVINEKDYTGVENLAVSLLRNYYLTDAIHSLQKEKSYYVPIKKRVLKDKIAIRTHVKLPKKLVQNSVDVTFETFKKVTSTLSMSWNEVPVERKATSIDVIKHARLFALPIRPPQLSFSDELVQLKQVDQHANYIKLEKKVVNNKGECTHYSSVLEEVVEVDKFAHFQDEEPDNKFYVYRCTSGEMPSTMMNPVATGMVVGRPLAVDSLALVVSDRPSVYGSVEVTVKYPPKHASQFKVARRVHNGSSFEDEVTIVPYRDFDGHVTTVVDPDVQHGNHYEYVLYYKTTTGETKRSVTQMHVYNRARSSTYVNVKIETPSFTNVNGVNTFQFNISTGQSYSQEDKTRLLFLGQNLNNEMKDLVEKASNNIGDFVYHKVARVNMKTGRREVFDFMRFDQTTNAALGTQILRDDEINRSNHSVSPIEDSTDYMYEVRTFVKNPLATAKDYVAKVTLPPTSVRASPKIYYYKPHKWRQHSTAETGTIPALNDDGTIVGRNILDEGELGVTATYVLSAANKNVSISSLVAERVDVNKVKVSWHTIGESRYDHFVIVKEVNRVRRFFGAVTSREFFDVLSNNDVGTIAYYLIPVHYDFSVGAPSKSNLITVDPEDFDFRPMVLEL